MAGAEEFGSGAAGQQEEGLSWRLPYLYGEAEALTSMGTIAAPLLGGFSLAAMVQTLTISTSAARWPDAVFLLFLLAAVLFVTSVQAMFWARGYQVTPQEIMDWWPDATKDPELMERLRREQRLHVAGFRMWSDRARLAYGAGLLCLLAALTLLAVPPEHYRELTTIRWLAVAVGSIAFTAEVTWIIGSFTYPRRSPHWMTRLLQPPPEDNRSDSQRNPPL